MTDTTETVRYDVIVELKASLEALRKMSDSSKTNEERIKSFADTVVAQSRRMNVSLEDLYKQYEKLNRAAVRKDKKEGFGEIMGKGGIFGGGGMGGMFGSPVQGGGQGLINAAKEYNEAGIAAKRLSVDQDGVAVSTKKVGDAAEESSKRFSFGMRVMSQAVGMLIHQGINLLINAFQQLFSMAINGLREMETQTYNLVNAERKLSGQGVEITPKDLDSYIKKLQQLDPMLSKIQATELISSVAIKVAPNLGLKKEDIDGVSQAIAVLAVRNKGLGKSIEEVQSEVENSLLSGRVQGINKLGVKITDQIVKDKAIADGLVANADAYDKLTGKEEAHIKALTIIRILEQNTNEERQHLPEFFKTADATFGIFQARLQDLMTQIGTILAPVLISVFKTLTDGLEKALVWIDKNKDALMLMGKELALLAPYLLKLLGLFLRFLSVGPVMFLGVVGGIQKIIDKFPGIKKLFDYLAEKGGVSYAAPDIASAPDTPTVPQVPEKIKIDTSDAQKELKDLLKDLEKLKEAMNDKEAKFQLDLGRFDADALKTRTREIEDYNRNVAETVKNFNTKKKEDNQKYRQSELESERKYQENMRKMQDEFQHSLEDALHERDARQVLRLIDKYNMDKTAAEREETLRKQTDASHHKQEHAANKAQLDDKLRVMAEEQAVKLRRMDEDSATRRQRMVEDHALEMAKLQEDLNDRIKQASDKMAEEYGINADGAAAIYKLLESYYGTNGALAKLTAGGYQAMLANAGSFLGQLVGIIGQYQGAMAAAASQYGVPGGLIGPPAPAPQYGVPGGLIGPPAPANVSNQKIGGGGTTKKFGGGGQFIATRPQQIIVGDAGRELVQITPMSQIANGVSDAGGVNGLGGSKNGQTQISVSVDLSPDLEARVVNKALDGTANVISKIRRGK